MTNITSDYFSKLMSPALEDRANMIHDLRKQLYEAVDRSVSTNDDKRNIIQDIIWKASQLGIELFSRVSTEELKELIVFDQLRDKLIGIGDLEALINDLNRLQSIDKNAAEALLQWANEQRDKIANAERELGEELTKINQTKVHLNTVLSEIEHLREQITDLVSRKEDWKKELVHAQLRMKQVVISDYFTRISLLSDFDKYDTEFQDLEDKISSEIVELSDLQNRVTDVPMPEFVQCHKIWSDKLKKLHDNREQWREFVSIDGNSIDPEHLSNLKSIQEKICNRPDDLSPNDWSFLDKLQETARVANIDVLPIVARITAQAHLYYPKRQRTMDEVTKRVLELWEEWERFYDNDLKVMKTVLESMRVKTSGRKPERNPNNSSTADKSFAALLSQLSGADRLVAINWLKDWQRRIDAALSVIDTLERLNVRPATLNELHDLFNEIDYTVKIYEPEICRLFKKDYVARLEREYNNKPNDSSETGFLAKFFKPQEKIENTLNEDDVQDLNRMRDRLIEKVKAKSTIGEQVRQLYFPDGQ